MNSKYNKKLITAAELMSRLEKDPDYIARMEAKKIESELKFGNRAAQVAPILSDLADIGYAVESLDELRKSGKRYRQAVPVLLKWLVRIDDTTIKDAIVRTLTVPWGKPEAIRVLINEFKGASNTENAELKWTIASALEVIADESVQKDIIALIQNPEHGQSREMLVLALGNMPGKETVKALKMFLKDDILCGHAIMTLRKLSAVETADDIEPFLKHRKAWVREEASKAFCFFKE